MWLYSDDDALYVQVILFFKYFFYWNIYFLVAIWFLFVLPKIHTTTQAIVV